MDEDQGHYDTLADEVRADWQWHATEGSTMTYRYQDIPLYSRECADSFDGPAIVLEVGGAEVEVTPDEARDFAQALMLLASEADGR